MVRSRSPRRRSGGELIGCPRRPCRCCGKLGADMEFGMDNEYCSSDCYLAAHLGCEAADWDPEDVTSWVCQHGGQRWSRGFRQHDGMQLLVKTNERTLRQLGMPHDRVLCVMRGIHCLRQGLWGGPEPPLGKLPLPTVAVKGKQWNPNWSNVLEDEERRSFCAFCPKAIDERKAWEWFEQLYNYLPWADLRDTKYQETGRTMPRRTVFVVDHGCSCVYGYSGVKVPPMEEPEFVAEIRKQCAKMAGYSDTEMPNACNINLYRDGQDSVGWHTDNEALFDAEACDATILSLSLGATRNFCVKKQEKWAPNGVGKPSSFAVAHGDLCTMEGKFQKYYLHAVPKEPSVKGPRINLTWRWITRHNKASGCKLVGEGN
mmetsp:Transcript_42565/g.97605  ORF Transcript_42565/g.97605 Transcript_42565/m.97605 type:complete len:373 (+) Transcript_42565:77-1195(+)